MDYQLPFGFLDHKLKCGNSLVGCWFDQFSHYPAMAWEREGGDKDHDRFVHHFREYVWRQKPATKGDVWTQLIADYRKNVVRPQLIEYLRLSRNTLPDESWAADANDAHEQARAVMEQLHSLSIDDSENRSRLFREFTESKHYLDMRLALDIWCALWFWPAEAMAQAPRPTTFRDPLPADTVNIVDALRERLHFFHWELEFPDVFGGGNPGFHAIVGNPPWEIQKPISKEFFSNKDPMYRGYGKQEALERQREYFQISPEIEDEWLRYRAHF